ncbi:lantibiotic dehydratase [Streptomyces sp. NPDC020875]|uniref:lantibiotic dehydratase n=1 Tax=Streptomyces sp. NPDC020875 TaxID=3154898 RepID=UPI0033C250CE
MGVFGFGPVAMGRVPLTAAEGGPPDPAGLFAEGLLLASRATADAAGSDRAAITRTAYAIRARTRTTPHGVWCAVAPVVLADGPSLLRLGTDHRPVSTPAPLWLRRCADRLLDEPEVLDRLELTTNNLAVRRGERFEAEYPAPGRGRLGSVRATDLSRWLLAHCADGAPGGAVIEAITARYPGADPGAAREAVLRMIRTGLLLTDFLPRDPRDDPLARLLARVPYTAGPRPALVRLSRALAHADRHPPGAARRTALLLAARRLADRLHFVDRPFAVDTVADAGLRLPADIGRRAAEAAEALWRVGDRPPPLGDWWARFTGVYGYQRAVPLLEAVDPVAGIGPPGPADALAARSDSGERRERVLARLLAEACADGWADVELTEARIRDLAVPGDGEPPRTAEIHVQVLASAAGSFRLVVGRHSAQTAGSAAGRFAALLPGPAPGPVAGNGTGDAPVVAEIVSVPATAETAGLAVETGFAPYRIPLGVPPRDGDLHPRDLVIVPGGGGRPLLWSTALGRPVLPVLFSRITRELLPAPARLLHLLGHAAERPWHTWSWGRAEVFPYTPRVTFRGTVLAPRRWLLPDELIAAAARRAAWHGRFADWLSAVRPPLPGEVVAEESDRRLPLRTADPTHREILRRAVLRGARALAESFGTGAGEPPVTGPGGGRHLLELVIPLHRSAPAAPASLDPRIAVRPRRDDLRPPGSEWLSAALAVPARHQDAALRRLPAAPATARMYWLRYRTPALGDQLRLRYRATPGTLREIRDDLVSWSTDLVDQGLSAGHLHHEPYVRETARYGGPGAVDAAEDVFAADSALALALLATDPPEGAADHRIPIAAAGAAAIALAVAAPGSGAGTAAGAVREAVRRALRGSPLTRAERRERDRLRPAVRNYRVPSRIAGAWAARSGALVAYGDVLPIPEIAARCASDLVHLSCNRLVGTDPGRERIVRSLATDLLYAHG